jgi:hypothetical protein
MTILALSRQHSKRSTLSGFLAVLFLAQALLLPWLTAPKLVVSAGGQWAVLCTLQGLQRVYVKSGEPAPLNTKGNHCPACTLAHAVSVPLPEISLAVIFSPLHTSGNVVYEEHVASRFDFNGHAIRAPPVA